MEKSVLSLPNHAFSFEVYTDGSNFSIKGVLKEGEHPIAFKVES